MEISKETAQEVVHALRLFAADIRKNIRAGSGQWDVRDALDYAESLDLHVEDLTRLAVSEWPDFTPMPPPGFGA